MSSAAMLPADRKRNKLVRVRAAECALTRLHRKRVEQVSLISGKKGAEQSGSAIRFKVVVTEDEVEVEGGPRKDYKVVASLKLPSVVKPPRADLLMPALPVDNYARLVAEGRRDDSCLVSLLEADVKRLDNQLRLVLEKISNVIELENCSEMVLMATLRERGYDQDPLIAWAKERHAFLRRHQPERQPNGGNETVEEANLGDTVLFNYLLDMPLWSFTREGMIALTNERKRKADQLCALRQMSFMTATEQKIWALYLGKCLKAAMDRVKMVKPSVTPVEASSGKHRRNTVHVWLVCRA
ncbi:hypothetical protein HPB50_009110 [Hyalomma asiaticum]|uniref:Uncharacterized protein n=1 Tax=Hyalomma asiaticum TaxID=266040 RepID=A0ACB7T3N7_HYAAI|nr:hypothetical protein HPB50_009110 [Hyalomma asiaticum]